MIELPEPYKHAPSFSFGDSPEMADSGLRDVIARKQVATCGAYELLNSDESTKPCEGNVEIVLDGAGQPGCAIRYTSIDTKRFNEIGEQFAHDEACESLDEWKSIHEAYFRSKGCFAPNMQIYRMYFEVVEVFERVLEN